MQDFITGKKAVRILEDEKYYQRSDMYCDQTGQLVTAENVVVYEDEQTIAGYECSDRDVPVYRFFVSIQAATEWLEDSKTNKAA